MHAKLLAPLERFIGYFRNQDLYIVLMFASVLVQRNGKNHLIAMKLLLIQDTLFYGEGVCMTQKGILQEASINPYCPTKNHPLAI